MNNTATVLEAAVSCPIRAAAELDAPTFERIRRTLMLDHCKWDSQVGDVTTLAAFPLVISATEWRSLAAWAEQLSAELFDIEQYLLHAPHLQRTLNVPAVVREIFEDAPDAASPAAARVMRFDFHYTPSGWQISEVNSDVPGGFSEASSFTALMAQAYPHLRVCGDPVSRWADALLATSAGAPIALLSAPGYMEDQQILAYLRQALASRGCAGYLCEPSQLRWEDGRASLRSNYYSGPLGAVVRFYQGEWLANLPERTGWRKLFAGAETPVANPGSALLTESKRLPLIFDDLPDSISTSACRRFFPETRDPRDVNWEDDAAWLLKTAFCNTGDTVAIRELLPASKWNEVVRDVRRSPHDWLAQRRFETVAVVSPLGPIYPCIGVYTINAKAAGVYARISTQPIIDFTAIDAALLVEEEEGVLHTR